MSEDIDEFARGKIPEGGVIGAYMVLAEVLVEDGVRLVITASEGIQPWTAMGMLMFAQESIADSAAEGMYEVDEDEDYI